jgi:hypothetical protein
MCSDQDKHDGKVQVRSLAVQDCVWCQQRLHVAGRFQSEGGVG